MLEVQIMPRASRHLEINSFIKGLITEASPLTFPDNASLDEQNFVLNIDGSRDRRLGIDYEDSYAIKTSAQVVSSTGELKTSTHNWKNAGGDEDKEIIVVQLGDRISFFDALQDSVSPAQIGADFEVGDGSLDYTYAVVDGTLVVATGDSDITLFTYDGTTITKSTTRIKVRDLWGVQAFYRGLDLHDTNNLNLRPNGPSFGTDPEAPIDEHIYNTRNQSWGVRRLSGTDRTSSSDPLQSFEADLFRYPSNSDISHSGVIFDPEDTANPPRERLYAYRVNNDRLTTEAPKGFFIIDALDRGTSRLTSYAQQLKNELEKGGFLDITSLPQDKTPGGATCVEEFAGRVFYGGFQGSVIGGDKHSPKLSSYIFFSKLVKQEREIGFCYQEGDPTGRETPDIVATDGGFIRLQGAYGIKRLVKVGNALIVLAENGVWMIRGESGIGFTATAYEALKLTDRGCVSANSVVTVDNSLLYWAEDGIYAVSPTQTQDYVAENITHITISQFYDNISEEDKSSVKGFFDSFERKVSWVYGSNLNSTSPTKILTLDTRLSAFYPYTIKTPSDGIYPKPVAAVQVPPFISGTTIDQVVVNGEQVQANLVDVQVTSSVRDPSLREIKYLTITGLNGSGQPQYTFSSFRDQDFIDWKTFDGTGVDAEAFLITGYLTGGDSSREKFVPNIYFHFKRTEEGFQLVEGDLVPTKPSSCKVQARWDWSNSAASNRWGKEFQAYRYSRHFIPETAASPFDSGFEVLTTRNRLRGKGQALSMKISSEAGKDLRILGWGKEVTVNGDV